MFIRGSEVFYKKSTGSTGALPFHATGKPYPLGITSSSDTSDAIVFDDWNSSASISAPKNAVDVSRLRG